MRGWGSSEAGQLGEGATYRSTPVAVVFDTVAPTTTAPRASLRAGRTLIGSAVPVRLGWSGADSGGTGVARHVVALSRDGGTTWRTVLTSLTTPYAYRTVPSSGTVRYRVRAIDRAANAGSWVAGPTLSARLVEQSSAAVRYTGRWATARYPSYSGGTSRYATAAGASATYTFTGRSIALVTTKGPTRGKGKVYVDGALAATVDLYGATPTHRVLAWAQTWASSGSHTVRLVVAGTRGRPRVDLDAFAVLR